MELISKSEMQARGLKKYFTGKPCRKGHIVERWYDGHCVECHRMHMAESFQRSKDQKREYRLQSVKNWRKENPERHKAIHNHSNALRKKSIRSQKIARRYLLELLEIYTNCPDGHHVDHIIPVLGKTVCGLHVPWNLQYLPAIDNIRKGNRLGTP